MARNVTDGKDGAILLGLLEAVASDGSRGQRGLASELGVAVGLVNAYLRRCVKKGLVKVHEAPARRYAYYLTPRGFAEKSRLTVQYLSHSFELFRRARSDCADIFRDVRGAGGRRVLLLGLSDVTEVAVLCALETDIEIVAIVDENAQSQKCAGVAVVRSVSVIKGAVDAAIVTAPLSNGAGSVTTGLLEAAADKVGAENVLSPRLFGYTPPSRKAAS